LRTTFALSPVLTDQFASYCVTSKGVDIHESAPSSPDPGSVTVPRTEPAADPV
jgi:hypothetical protein